MYNRYIAFIMIGVALVAALAATVMSYRWVQARAEKPEPTITAVVATQDLSWGTALKADMLTTAAFPEGTLPDGYFSNPELVKDRILVAQVKAREPILEDRLAPTAITSGGLTALITPGKRAMAIGINPGMAEYISPRSKVDILVTLKRGGKTRIVLQNVPVLTIKESGSRRRGRQRKIAILEVTPEEGERLALAAHQGVLQLALRNPVDKDFVATRGADIAAIINPPVQESKQPAAMQASIYEIEIIRGSSVVRQAF